MDRGRTVDRMGPSTWAVAAVAIPTTAVALLLNLAIRAVAVGRFGVPAPALPLLAVIMPSLGAVLGTSLGWYLAFRRPGPNSMRNFLLPGVGFTLMGIAVEVVRFSTDHGHLGALVVGASHGLVAIALATIALLWLLGVEG